ncbi:thioredoxin family protein [Methanococcus maripaludis]|uniref:Thioredoxin n=1 Tax=Methanococcus maripaludis TaxID=39152 RepID=A0A2L1C7V7_METMI|nr:thioredoxin family protein [Methanococcus maripaludis]AVB75452.1 Thioredoxin [Methanococcus maripaludis]MBA2863777.1 thioredoxin 1 [Methanococcus maripaludis]MBB6496217.1 thioredoxin 1 [Methanococcus maripaludis]
MKHFLNFLVVILLIVSAGCISTEKTDLDMNGQNLMIEFYSTTCPACEELSPHIDELEDEGYNISRINVNENGQMAINYGINLVPTVVFIKNGEEVDRVIGNQPEVIKSKAEEYFK